MNRSSIFIASFLLLVFSASGIPAYSREATLDNHTRREEAEGKDIWEKLQSKQLECKNLSDNDFESLGEYFMGQMAGSSHESMNTMMAQMMGKEGEEQMHVVMGERLSGCRKGGGNPMMGYGGWNNMVGGWGSFGLGWLFMLLFWILLIVGIIALIRYIVNSGKSIREEKSPLEILKERYARGEINKKEFEEKKEQLL